MFPSAVSNPRQTSGEKSVQPKWNEALTITVGSKDADIVGRDNRAIQSAVDYVSRLGGGTVHILAGTYRLRNAVYLQTGVHLIGSGNDTILIKEPSARKLMAVEQRDLLNTVRGNAIGIFFCWGVKYGLAENNQIEGNRIGISIGHRDTDNLITSNSILSSKLNGVLFRPERCPDFAGHRNRIVNNTFIDNAPEAGAVIDIRGGTELITILDNKFTETRSGKPRVSVKQGADTKNIVIQSNTNQGLEP